VCAPLALEGGDRLRVKCLAALLRSCQKPEMGNDDTLGIGGLKRVSLLRFFSRLKRNEVPPRTGANSKSQENPTYAERPR
jgi:hypothetical protein